MERTIDLGEEKTIQKKTTRVRRLAVSVADAVVAVVIEDLGLEGREAFESGLSVVACLEVGDPEGKTKHSAVPQDVEAAAR